MHARVDADVDRRIRQVAATYRRQGYRVTDPGTSAAIPTFLHGCTPDLIAEKEGDHVVIEVKRASALRGANDVADIAERVAATPGWRFEVVALPSESETTGGSASDWLNIMLRRRAHDDDMTQQCIYLAVVLERLLEIVASHEKLRVREKTGRKLAAELAYHGVIDQTLLERINTAFSWRSELVHGTATPSSPVEQASEIESVCRELLEQSMAEA